MIAGSRGLDILQQVAHVTLVMLSSLRPAMRLRHGQGAGAFPQRARAIFPPGVPLQKLCNRSLDAAGIRTPWIAPLGDVRSCRRFTRLSEPVNRIAPYRKFPRASVLPAPHCPCLIARCRAARSGTSPSSGCQEFPGAFRLASSASMPFTVSRIPLRVSIGERVTRLACL